ncbi:MAG TPA: polysaccharide deacetylase family protein [Actinocrinis sp.]|nr:polysaccharide deacetylase family protein [Actinocrinis sp.]
MSPAFNALGGFVVLWTLKLDGTMQPINERPTAQSHADQDLQWTVPAPEADLHAAASDLAETVVAVRPPWTPAPAPVASPIAPAVASPTAKTAAAPGAWTPAPLIASPIAPPAVATAAPLVAPPAAPVATAPVVARARAAAPSIATAPAAAKANATAAAPAVSPSEGLHQTRKFTVPNLNRNAADPIARRSDSRRGEHFDLYGPSPADVARLSDCGWPDGPSGNERGPAEFSPAKRRASRRKVLFAAGGVTLLGGLGVFAAQALGTGTSHASAAGLPAGHTTNPSPSDLSSSPARTTTPPTDPPTTPPPSAGPTSNSTTDPSQVQSKPEFYVNNGPKGIALTLDDGPTAEYTPQVLALLQKYGIIATFCMIGNQIPPNAALVREVVAAGHTVVNHTWDHADQTKITPTQIRDSISRTSDALNAVGVTPTVFRAPYGSWNSNVFQACADARLRPLDWSVDPQDWARPGSSVIVQRVMKQTKTGSIILEHDGGGDRSQTVAALSVFLPELLNAGYRFGPI